MSREQFSVTPLPAGPHIGLLVDGDNQFLLADCTVVHNSYSLGVWAYLDWRRDPDFTNIQIVGPSEKHLERNLFSHLVKLHNQSSVPAPGEVRQLEITTDPHQKDSGLFGVVVPIGKKAAGRLQGVKIVRRPKPHPQLGPVTRVRMFLEEAENIPVGIWEDVTNTLANTAGVDRFKIFAPFNPKDANSQCAIRCEPVGGWDKVDIETSEEWMSRRGWKVVRLDAHKSENVIENREVFFGLQTKEGLDRLVQNAGGVGSPGYYTMARGWYPPSGVDFAIIPQYMTHDLYGEFEFVESKPIAGVDVALEGEDSAVCALGRVGLANGWRRPGSEGKKGELVQFKDSAGHPTRRFALQLDQILTYPKGNTLQLVAEIRKTCTAAGIKGDHLGVDRTGNGAGTHDILVTNWNSAVHGINGSRSPTERRILQEDTKLPCDEYANLLTELWFGARKYIEFGFFKVHPNVPQDPLVAELTGRRRLSGGIKIKAESKADYKSRGNKSPDRADACTILCHIARQHSGGPPAATFSSAPADDRPYVPRISCTDSMDYL